HDHIHRAASAVCGAGFDASRLTSLARLVEPETVRALLRYQWEVDGCKFTAYCRDVAATLIVIASEWVKVPNEQLAELKKLRAKLGSERPGLTEKNSTLLRKFEDPHLVGELIDLPDKLWRAARRMKSPWWFIELQTALAIDIVLHVPLRIENLAALKFDEHLHW